MHLQPATLALALALPLASAQLNELAKKAGKLYFGTATDNGELSTKQYFDILTDGKEFGQLTPSNGMKVCFPPLCRSPTIFLTKLGRGIMEEHECTANEKSNSGLPLSPSRGCSTTPWALWWRI